MKMARKMPRVTASFAARPSARFIGWSWRAPYMAQSSPQPKLDRYIPSWHAASGSDRERRQVGKEVSLVKRIEIGRASCRERVERSVADGSIKEKMYAWRG